MLRRAAAVIACSALLQGCSTLGGLFDDGAEPIDAASGGDRTAVQTYLADVDRLLGPDASTADRAWREVSLDYERAPTTTNTLRLALALGTPGHANTDLGRADALLTELLLRPELLLTDEQLLASVHLGLLRSRISAESVARQASNTATRSNERELAAARAQLELLQSDNARLRAALAETQKKLSAITEIERSIRERDEDGAAPPPGAIRPDE